MNETKLTIHTFEMGTPKESAVKVLEEASEVRGSWQVLNEFEQDNGTSYGDSARIYDWHVADLADEIADVIQASCNLAARYGINLQAAMERCEQRNRERGRYADDERCGSCDGNGCDCGGDCVPEADGVGAVPKPLEEMSVEQLRLALRIANREADEFTHERDNALQALAEGIEHARELSQEVADLTHERDELRNRLMELSDAGITDLHRLLRQTLGEAKHVTDNAHQVIERYNAKQREACMP